MGGIGLVAEPLLVITLLVGGTWINRNLEPGRRSRSRYVRRVWSDDLIRERHDDAETRSTSPSLLVTQEPKWRKRQVGCWGMHTTVATPNSRRFRGHLLSRLLERFPFLLECWYWALIYWIYQLGRAATAVWIMEGTVYAARKHALQVIGAEQTLHMFWELEIQHLFIDNQFVMTWINRTYSFIHIPGSIAFLVWLFYYTHTNNESEGEIATGETKGSFGGPTLYESRRRTMALCNLLAFVIFTAWPCMPPRLLSADNSEGEVGQLARSFGFVDTVHGPGGEGSVWTDNRFTNKFAAMPSLHFGYSLLIGLTIATIPLRPTHDATTSIALPLFNQAHPDLAPKVTIPRWRRILCISIGTFYPALILVAITATANHFILDAIAGSLCVGFAWFGNDILLNLLVVEDWFLWVVRISKPESTTDLEEDFSQGLLLKR